MTQRSPRGRGIVAAATVSWRCPWIEIARATSTLSLALLASCGDGASTAPARDEPPRATSRLEARTDLALLEGSHPRVEAELPGRGRAVLLVDTGAQYTVLSSAFARAHGLALEPFDASAGAPTSAPGRRIEHVARVPELLLGAASVRDVRIAVLDFAGLDHLAGTDGILGQDLLRSWFAVIDGPGRRLVLLPRCTIEEAFAQLFEGRTGALRFDVDWSLGVPRVRLPLAGAGEIELLIDTGANFLCLPPEPIAALGLAKLRTERVQTLEGEAERDVYELPRTSLGVLTIRGEVQAWEHGVLGWSVLEGAVLAQEGESGVVMLVDRPAWK